MNFFQLECFEMAVEKSSFIEVATAMHVTPPTITYQITNLEDELGEELFIRNRKGVEATRAGLIFYEHAKNMLAVYRNALSSFKHAVSEAESVIHIGFTRPPDNYDFFAAIHKYRALNPNIIVDVVENEIIYRDDPNLGSFDILFHFVYDKGEYGELEYAKLGECRYYATLSAFSGLAQKESVMLDELREYKFFLLNAFKNSKFQVPALRDLKRMGFEIRTFDNMDNLLYAIADDQGFGIYPAKYKDIKSGFKRVAISDLPPLEYGILYRKTHPAHVEECLRFLISELDCGK